MLGGCGTKTEHSINIDKLIHLEQLNFRSYLLNPNENSVNKHKSSLLSASVLCWLSLPEGKGLFCKAVDDTLGFGYTNNEAASASTGISP